MMTTRNRIAAAVLLLVGGAGYATAQDAVLAEAMRRGLLTAEGQPTRYSSLSEQERNDSLSLTNAERAELRVLQRERFGLLTVCAPMRLFVGVTTPNAAGLTHESLQNLVESRLRVARLYREFSFSTNPLLHLGVNVIGPAFSVELELSKVVHDHISGQFNRAATWEIGRTGTHGGDANYIPGVVSQMLDEFLVEYLRVNEDACD